MFTGINRSVALLAVVSGTLFCGDAFANLITNGDFSANAAGFISGVGYCANADWNNPLPAGWSQNDNTGYVFGYVAVNGGGTSVGSPFSAASRDIYTSDGLTNTGNQVVNYVVLQTQSFDSYIQQNISFAPNTTYTLSFVVAVRNGFDSGGEVLKIIVNDGNTQIAGIPTVTPTASYFTTASITFTTGESAGTGHIRFLNDMKGGDRSILLTNVSMDAVPETSTSLLSIGLATVLLRRRRQIAR